MPKKKFEWLGHNNWQGIGAIAAIIVIPLSLLSLVIASRSSFPGQPPAKVISTPQITVISSPISSASATITPIPTPTLPPTPTTTPCPTAIPAPSTTGNGNVYAIIPPVEGCPPENYPITWIFGFKTGRQFGEGITSATFMGGGNLGEITDLGFGSGTSYQGPPPTIYVWVEKVVAGGYAIVLSDSSTRPTQQQLGYAVLVGEGGGQVNGSYLSPNYLLSSTTPQPRGVTGYQFNLEV